MILTIWLSIAIWLLLVSGLISGLLSISGLTKNTVVNNNPVGIVFFLLSNLTSMFGAGFFCTLCYSKMMVINREWLQVGVVK